MVPGWAAGSRYWKRAQSSRANFPAGSERRKTLLHYSGRNNRNACLAGSEESDGCGRGQTESLPDRGRRAPADRESGAGRIGDPLERGRAVSFSAPVDIAIHAEDQPAGCVERAQGTLARAEDSGPGRGDDHTGGVDAGREFVRVLVPAGYRDTLLSGGTQVS